MSRELRVTRHRVAAIGATVLLAFGVACDDAADPSVTMPFQEAAVRFEQNATDGDMEAVFTITSGDVGLAELRIVGPDGRVVTDFQAPDQSTMGIRSFQFETPEPEDTEGLKAAYPEGVYQFSGRTVSGDYLAAEATLSHALPATASFIHPPPDGDNVAFDQLSVSWNAVEGVANYILEIEQDEMNVNLTVRLPGSQVSFPVPPRFLIPGTEYQLSIGTVLRNGNTSFVETSFTTSR